MSDTESSNRRTDDDRIVDLATLPCNREGATIDDIPGNPAGDSDDDRIVDLAELPCNREGATIDGIQGNPAGDTSQQEDEPEYNYKTIMRCDYRLSLLEKYLANPSQVPKMEDFLYSKVSEQDKNSIEYRIWGSGEDSLQSQLRTLETYQSQLVALQAQEDLKTLENPSDHNASSEDSPEVRRLKQALIEKDKALIKEKEEKIKVQEALIKEKQAHIKEKQARIKEKLEKIKNILASLAGKGNETATGTSFDLSNLSRVDNVPVQNPLDVMNIHSDESDQTFLNDLLDKNKITDVQKESLVKLQDFVDTILQNANVASKRGAGINKRINAFAHAILAWTPETEVPSCRTIKDNYARPPPKGCETTADQPILCAVIFKILALLGKGSTPLTNEQALAPAAGTPGQLRKIDFVVDEHMEFLHLLFPEKLGRVIEVKAASYDKYKDFKKNQKKGQEQVIGHLSKQLLCAFDFGGIGHDDVVCGIVLSMVSVQVVEMQLKGIGTDELHIKVLQTPLVPLFRGINIPDDEKPNWDMDRKGVLLLASALLDIPQKSLFGNDSEKIKFDDESAHRNDSSLGQEPGTHVGMEIKSFLGSGSFAHVFALGKEEFMKIPRSKRMAKSLRQECNILEKLKGSNKPWFPMVISPGVSLVKVSIRNELSQLNVLRLKGIVGCSLGSYCQNNPQPDTIDKTRRYVIEEVYKALEYAHSKDIIHMDVRPSNIIVRAKENGIDVLLTDWGCSMGKDKTIKMNAFVGCTTYAHDELLRKRNKAMKPKEAFDFAALACTWYHIAKGIDWQFDRPTEVTNDQLEDRREKMKEFLEDSLNADTAALVPKVRNIFVPETKKRTWAEYGRDAKTYFFRAYEATLGATRNGGDS